MATRLHSHVATAQHASLQPLQPSVQTGSLPKAAHSQWQEFPEEIQEIDEDGLEVRDDDEALAAPEEVIVAGRMRRAAQKLSFSSSKSLDRLIEHPQTESYSSSSPPSQQVEQMREEPRASPGLLPSQLTEVTEDVSFSSLPRQRREQLQEESWVASAALPSHGVENLREESCSSYQVFQADEARDEPFSSLNSFSSYQAIEVDEELHFPSGFFPSHPSQEKEQVRDERRISFGSLPGERWEVESPNPEQPAESLECSPLSVNPEDTKRDLGFRDHSGDISPAERDDPPRFFRNSDADNGSHFRDRPLVWNRQMVIMEQLANSEPSPRPGVGLPKRVPKPPPGIKPSGSPRKRQAYVHNASSPEASLRDASRQLLKGKSLFPKVVPSVAGAQASSKRRAAGELDYGLDELKRQGQVILASLRTHEAQLLKATGHPARESYKASPKATGWHQLQFALTATSGLRSGISSGVP